jgi:hypothetical protein
VSATTIRSFLLTDDGDLDVSAGKLQFATGLQAMKQAVRSSILLFLGEWFLNTDQGTPWRQLILIKNPNISFVKTALRDAITRVEGVTAINALDVSFDLQTRSATVSFSATCDLGVFDDSVTV